ncbi:hypothetical protein BDZ89DRAFT_192663 [Hymenopellis radicata]|nr:hypothetical protein BDZ89DRAFT_192663 [Hymenopellis radicata]
MSITSQTLDLGLEYPPTPPLSDCASRPHSPDRESSRTPFTTIHYQHTVMDSTRKLSPWSVGSHEASTTIYLASYDSSKPVIAAIASSIAKEEALRPKDQDTSFCLTVEEMKWRLEGKNGLPPSNFMIVHPLSPSKYNRTALELHGFPPFQTRLTEVYHNRLLKRHDAWINWILPSRFYARRLPVPLTEVVFREALDEFAGAEMRFGK